MDVDHECTGNTKLRSEESGVIHAVVTGEPYCCASRPVIDRVHAWWGHSAQRLPGAAPAPELNLQLDLVVHAQ
jgi:hypothetical protein